MYKECQAMSTGGRWHVQGSDDRVATLVGVSRAFIQRKMRVSGKYAYVRRCSSNKECHALRPWLSNKLEFTQIFISFSLNTIRTVMCIRRLYSGLTVANFSYPDGGCV